MQDKLTLSDTRSGVSVDIPISKHKTINASYLTQFRIPQTIPPPENPGDTVPVRVFDHGLKNTNVSTTKISLVDGNSGKLYYRGYDIEDLVENSSYLEVSFLLIYGHLPSINEFDEWKHSVMTHTYIHTELERQMQTFRYDAHPMGMFISTMASMSTFHPEGNPALQGEGLYQVPKKTVEADNEYASKVEQVRSTRNKHIWRMIGKATTVAANAYRHRIGREYNKPMPESENYCENLLFMMDKLNEKDYKPDPRLVSILDKVFIVLAEHGSNCSTVIMRHLTSSGVDPYTALSGSMASLFGERKCHAVIEMLSGIGSKDNVESFLDQVKSKNVHPITKKPVRLMGFGHRVYKTADPRVKILKRLALQIFDLVGKDKIGELALYLEEQVLSDDWFSTRKLYANVDYWSAIILYTLGFPKDMFPVWLAIPRISGFLAHWQESLDDPEYKIFRPRQIYTGSHLRPVQTMVQREMISKGQVSLEATYVTADPVAAKRRVTAIEQDLAPAITDLIKKTSDNLQELNAAMDQLNGEIESDPSRIAHVLNWFRGSMSSIQQTSLLASTLQTEQQELMKKFSEFQARNQLSVPITEQIPKSPDLTKGSSNVRPISKE